MFRHNSKQIITLATICLWAGIVISSSIGLTVYIIGYQPFDFGCLLGGPLIIAGGIIVSVLIKNLLCGFASWIDLSARLAEDSLHTTEPHQPSAQPPFGNTAEKTK